MADLLDIVDQSAVLDGGRVVGVWDLGRADESMLRSQQCVRFHTRPAEQLDDMRQLTVHAGRVREHPNARACEPGDGGSTRSQLVEAYLHAPT